MLYYVAATRGTHGCTQRHPGHRQPQPEGLQRLQDGAGRPRDLRRRDPGACAGASRPRATRAARAAARRWTSCAEYRARIVGDCKLARPMKIVVDSGNGIPGAIAPGILRALGCEVIELYSRGRRRLPEPPPRPEQAREPGRPDQGRARHRRRTRPGLRRRRRPPGRRHQGRPDHLPRPPADAVRARRPVAPPGRARSSSTSSARSACAPAIREAGGVPLMWKTGHSLIKAKLSEIGAPLRRRDERPHLLRRALVRLRRRDVHRGAAARDPVAQRRSERGARRAADELLHARAERALRRGRAPPRRGRAAGARGRRPAGVRRRGEVTPSTACASTTPTASA